MGFEIKHQIYQYILQLRELNKVAYIVFLFK